MPDTFGTAGGAFIPSAPYALSGSATLTSPTLTSPTLTTPTISSPVVSGTATASGTYALVNSLTAAAYAASAVENELLSRITLTPSTTVTAANGLNAIRGEVILTSGKTLGSGAASYVAGVYGRGNIFGTVNIASGALAAVYAKFDLNGSTLSAGHIAPLQSNIVNPPATAVNVVDLIYTENASGTKVKSILSTVASAAYAFDFEEVGGAGNFIVAAAVGGSQDKKLKCNINGTTYYIPLNTA